VVDLQNFPYRGGQLEVLVALEAHRVVMEHKLLALALLTKDITLVLECTQGGIILLAAVEAQVL
jgi:hypothetical protein